MKIFKKSVAEICQIAETAKASGIYLSFPATAAGISYRAREEGWEYSEAPTKGGKGGLKKVYTVPSYIVDELEEKGLMHLIEDSNNTPQGGIVPSGSRTYTPKTSMPAEADTEYGVFFPSDAVPPGMEQWVKNYGTWSSQQDTGLIVPVRYHVNVYGSAGSGAVAWNAEETEAMWFRASFFKHLGVNPNRCFCTRVKGDSMFPTLIDLGTALWYATAKYSGEGIYLFRQYDEIRIKRLQRLNAHTFNIISDNANKVIYPNTELDLSQAEPHDFEILGHYLWSCGIAK